MLDREALCWFLKEKICDINDVDSEGQDVLSLAIAMDNMLFLNDILSGGAQVKREHLIHAASLGNYEIIGRLALLYRYSECPKEYKPAGLNFFR